MRYQDQSKNRRKGFNPTLFIMLCVLLASVCWYVSVNFKSIVGYQPDENMPVGNSDGVTSGDTTSDAVSESPLAPLKLIPPYVSEDDQWMLILVNSENMLDESFKVATTKFDTQYIDSRVADDYTAMCEAALEDGITLYLRSGYRSVSTQATNYNNEIARYMGLGNSEEEATALTQQYYAIPGASEHHTGLALDIITPEYHNEIYTLNEQFAETEAYEWLVANCTDYGFILRYTNENQHITGFGFEPWHYRYVGVATAKFLEQNNLTLEEYYDLLD